MSDHIYRVPKEYIDGVYAESLCHHCGAAIIWMPNPAAPGRKVILDVDSQEGEPPTMRRHYELCSGAENWKKRPADGRINQQKP